MPRLPRRAATPVRRVTVTLVMIAGISRQGCRAAVVLEFSCGRGVWVFMQEPRYYRDQAARARRLARGATNRDLESLLLAVAVEYQDIAEDLESGAIEIRHPELLPQKRR